MKVRNVTVRIARHAGVDIEKVVPAWEVRVLNAIFDEPNVVQVGSASYELVDDRGEPKNFNAREEFDQLVRRYSTATDSDGGKILYTAYRDAGELGDAFQRMKAVWDSEDEDPFTLPAQKNNRKAPAQDSAIP